MIDWAAFSWEAFATLVTGMAAVIGASLIGFRQVGIQEKQAEIQKKQTLLLDSQVKLDSLRYNAELFDKRFEVYRSTSEFLQAIATDGKEPDPEIQRKFIRAMDSSRFLFAPSVHTDLVQIWQESADFGFLAKQVERGKEAMGLTWAELCDKERSAFEALSDRVPKVSEIFGEELRLSDHRLRD